MTWSYWHHVRLRSGPLRGARDPASAAPQRARKLAISLPPDVFEEMERARSAVHRDRSGWIQEAVRRYLGQREREARIAAYVHGYTEVPETDEEIELAREGTEALARYLDDEE